MLPKIIMMQQPNSVNDTLKKIWEYQCTVDDNSTENKKNYIFHSGGNVTELQDNSLFVSMSGSYSKIFIVSPDKNILWSAISEQWNVAEKQWDPIPQYRASMITSHAELEQLVWNDETTNR